MFRLRFWSTDYFRDRDANIDRLHKKQPRGYCHFIDRRKTIAPVGTEGQFVDHKAKTLVKPSKARLLPKASKFGNDLATVNSEEGLEGLGTPEDDGWGQDPIDNILIRTESLNRVRGGSEDG